MPISTIVWVVMRPSFAFRAKKPLHTGVSTGCHYLVSLSVRLSVCVCVTFVVIIDCESYTRPISTNPGSMEAGEYGRRAAVDFVVCFWVGRFLSCSFFNFFFFERTRPAASMRPPCLIQLYNSTIINAASASCLLYTSPSPRD